MARRRKPRVKISDGYINPDIHEFYELQFGKDIIKPGTIIKIKGTRGTFRYRKHAHNSKLDVTWVDVVHNQKFSYHSFYIDKIRGIVKPKRSRRKKANA